MNSGYKISSSKTSPILEWILDKNNRDKHITEIPEHNGMAVVKDNLQIPSVVMYKDGFPYKDLYDISKEILSFYQLPDSIRIEPNYGYMLCYSENGHWVHEHNDPNFYYEGPDESLIENKPDGYLNEVIHTRFNLLISKPTKGGNPVICDQEYDVEENEVWRCLAGFDKHGTTKVEGSKPRIILSFGFFVPTEIAIKNSWYKPNNIE
jgi:hypothetical protein